MSQAAAPLIAPFQTGLHLDVDPWLAPADSFQTLSNFDIYEGRVEKREGYLVFGALKPQASAKTITNVTQADPGVLTVSSHGYSTGDKVFISSVGGMTEINNKIFTITVIDANSFSINIDTTSFTAYTSGGNVAVTNTSTDRVMGVMRFIKSDGSQAMLAFNTRRAFLYDGAAQSFNELDAANIMNGGEYDYIWGANWQSSGFVNRLYFTNGLALSGGLNGIRYFDIAAPTQTTSFAPTVSTGVTLNGAKLIFTLGQRLVVLYTFENSNEHPQRARWSSKQNPSKWNDTIAGEGDFADAATGEQIISARLLKNQLIVFFTNSVWALVPTSDPNKAFRWQRLNSFRACDGRMASVAYDEFVAAVGIRGIVACNGSDTQRIDHRIHDFVVNNINVKEFKKVFCERSYANRRAWTLYPAVENSENNGALIYADESQAFSTYDISLNCLGFGNFTRDFALEDFTAANKLDLSINDESVGDATLLSYYWQDTQETLLGGDLHGNLYILETTGTDNGETINSKLLSAYWNPFKEEGAEALMPYIDIYIETSLTAQATLNFFKDNESSPYLSQNFDFFPDLNFIATITGASQENPCSVTAHQHGLSTGDEIYIYHVKGMVDINSGETANAYTITVVDENTFTLDGVDATSFDEYEGGGELYLRPFYRIKTWKRIFCGGTGFQHQIQIITEDNDGSFSIDAFKPYFKKRGRRMIN